MTQTSARTWLITGCDKGMGRAIAEAALRNGDRVAATVLDPSGTSSLVAQFPGQCRSFHLDVRRPEQAQQVVAETLREFGGIDVLVNNAGFGLVGAAEETSVEEYTRLFQVNFFGLVEVTRAVLPSMRERRRGHVINISSLVGFVGFSGMALYSASKFAVEGYSESLAREVAPLGLRVTIVEPGGFRSDFAGASLVTAGAEIADYAPTAGLTRTYLRTRHGTQPGDPAKLATALVQVSRMSEPPLRLPLGSDAWQQVTATAQAILAEAERWKQLSHSTDFAADAL